MKFSIIIPIYNAEFISYQLDTFLYQDFHKNNFELIYVDDGSSKKYRDIYKNLFQKYPSISIRYSYFWNKNNKYRASQARDIWWRQASYENIVFIDADCLVPKYYLKNLSHILRKNNYDIVLWESIGYNHNIHTPKIIPEDIVQWNYDIYINDIRFDDFRNKSYTHLWHVFIAGNLFLKKSILQAIWWWDRKIQWWWGEDIDLWYRLHRAWYKMHFLKGIEVYNIKDEERINATKMYSFMENQCYLLKKYSQNKDFKDYVIFRYNNTFVKDKIGIMTSKFRSMFFPKKKLIIYCSSEYGRGHFVGVLKMYYALKNMYDIRIFFSWKVTSKYLEWIDYRILNKNHFVDWNIETIRNKYFIDFIPDIFLIDFFPFWKFNYKENIDFLIDITKDNHWKVYSCMRDIFDGQMIGKNKALEKKLTRIYKKDTFYEAIVYAYNNKLLKYLSKIILEDYIDQKRIDKIFVFGDKKIHNIADEYQLSEEYREKITYLWYLTNEYIKYEKKLSVSSTIVVSSWWSFYNRKNFLLLLKFLSKFSNLQIYFFPWDDISLKERKSLEQYILWFSNIILKNFSYEYYTLLSQADIAFIAGGYNSFSDIFQYNVSCYVLWYGQYNPSIETNIFEIEARLKKLDFFPHIHRLYDFDFKKIQDIIKHEYTFLRYHEKKEIYSFINKNAYKNLQKII